MHGMKDSLFFYVIFINVIYNAKNSDYPYVLFNEFFVLRWKILVLLYRILQWFIHLYETHFLVKYIRSQ